MTESELYAGIATTLLDKFAGRIIKGLTDPVKKAWEQFKIDFDIVFRDYLKNSVEKYGKIKTILYRTEPKPLNEFFECPNLRKGRSTIVSGESIDDLLDISHFLIIEGTGGIGKSTFLKYVFLKEVSKREYIPVFIELKDINQVDGEYEISDFIFQKLFDLGGTMKKECMDYALQSGCFLFLLDGYDEISTDKKDAFLRKFERFCDRFPDNYFIVSSRPYSEFVEFQRFSVLTLCNLSKEQALSLINKIEFDIEIKQRFLEALDKKLYKRHQSFASNPLLLNIMLLTFDNYAEIPEKLHLFYANAFETLYSKHDATKSGFRRELKCGLSYDAFKKTFAQFCFITYYQGKIELTHDEVVTILVKIGARMVGFNPQNYIFDLVNSICVLYKDGLNYKFTHRSFQEYFAAIFLKELPDQDMGKIGTSLVKKDYYQSAHDSVFPMLYDMAEQRFEQNILLPFVIEFETVCEKADKYDFYYEKIEPVIEFDYAYSENSEDNPRLFLYGYFDKDPVSFIYSMVNHYRNRSQVCLERSAKAEKRLLDLLTNKFGKSLGERVEMSSLDDKEVYSLFKSTWIGEQLNTMAKLRETLEHRRRRETQDLFGFLDG